MVDVTRQDGIRMRLLNLGSLRGCDRDLSLDVEQLDTTSTTIEPDIRSRMLKGHREDLSNIAVFSQVLGISIQIICPGLI